MAGPTLTAFTDASPCPRVEVFFASFAAGTATVTVYRLAGGREHRVRGAVRAPVSGALSRIDFEVPFGVPVTYRAEQFNAAGISLGFTDSSSVTIDSADSWMHNPLDPAGAARVIIGDETAKTITRPTPGVVSRPKGRVVGVVLSEPRQGVTGLQVLVRTSADADADRVQGMVGDDNMPPVVCIRLGGDDRRMRVPQPLFLSALSVAEIDVNHRWGGSELAHSFEGDEVDPPTPGLYVPLLRRKDLDAFFVTRAAMDASAMKRSDLDRRYDLAGFGG
ncbi:hypothetical protein [Microbacterium sp. MMO-10]|uniref:hypothetical protein n=1 Tax=Microbacterium sp. MMO-10 TaxID=3081272 RepID=UPI0030160369